MHARTSRRYKALDLEIGVKSGEIGYTKTVIVVRSRSLLRLRMKIGVKNRFSKNTKSLKWNRPGLINSNVDNELKACLSQSIVNSPTLAAVDFYDFGSYLSSFLSLNRFSQDWQVNFKKSWEKAPSHIPMLTTHTFLWETIWGGGVWGVKPNFLIKITKLTIVLDPLRCEYGSKFLSPVDRKGLRSEARMWIDFDRNPKRGEHTIEKGTRVDHWKFWIYQSNG